MKINPILLLISFAIASLAGYGFFSANSGDSYQLLLTFGSGILIFITLSGIMAIQSTGGRGGVGNIRVLSIVFLVIYVISNIIFSFVALASPAAYIITNGIVLLVYILIAYAVIRALR